MKRAWLWAAGAMALGCSSVVVETSTSSSTGGGGGAAMSSSSSSSSSGNGAGGAIDFTTSSSSGGAPACEGTSVFIDVAGDVSLHFNASCALYGSITWLSGPTPPQPGVPGMMHIFACDGAAPPSPSLLVTATADTWPASATAGYTRLVLSDATYTSESGGVLEVVNMEPTGGVIEGKFAVTLALMSGSGPASINITGAFRVCHGPDSFTV